MGDFYNRGGGGLSATTITATTITADDLEVDGGTLSIDETNNRLGIGTTAPGTQLQLEGAAPYVTLKNNTSENTDGGCESKLIFEDHANASLGQIEVNHNGSSDDTKGKMVLSTHNGTSLTPAITIDDTQAVTLASTITATGFTIGNAVIAESELEQIDGITAGTVVASKAVVVDGNKDVGTIRNLTIDGTFSDGNYTFDTSGNVSGLGTVGCGAITSSGDISTTGEIKTAKVAFTDGDDAITIADGGGITANTSLTLASGATVTAINDEDNMTSNSATALATQQSIKAYVDSQTSGSGNMDNWILEDDSGDEVTVSNGKEVKFIGSGITTNWTDTDNGTDADPYDLTFTVDADQTGITSVVNSSLEIGRDADNRIKFGTDNQIIFEVDGGDNVIFKTGGEIEATSLDISGDITVGGGDATLGAAGNTTATTISTVTNTGTTVGKSLTISAGSTTTNGNNLNGGDLILASGGGDGTGTSSIQFKTKVSGTDAAAERMRIHTDGNVGIGTNSPGNLLHVAGADAYLLLQNTTAENGEGEAETRILFGDHSGTGLAMIEASHSGTADDTKGKFIVFTHNGSSLTPAITVDDTQAAVFASTVTATGFTIGSAVISEAELEILDGASVITDELNLLDGDTSVGGSITIADSDGFIVNDAGTMKTIPASDLKTYAGGGGGTAADDSNLILHMQVFA